jgi:gas vesicle structural protein
MTTTYNNEVLCAPRYGTLYDTLELILDRGMVIDVFVRVSLVGIEILQIDARIVVASVDTYLRFAEACNRIDLSHDTRSTTVPELFAGGASRSMGTKKAKRAARSVGSKVRQAVEGPLGDGEEDEDVEAEEEWEEEPRPRRRATTAKPKARRSTRRAREE